MPTSLISAYRSGALGDLFSLANDDLEGALRSERTVDRTALADALSVGMERWGLHPAQRRSLERLRHPDSRVVITGQQIGWLLGPNYTLSKAVAAVRMAQQLDRDERPVVPVFWMATQDHDTAEVDHAWILGRDERLHRLQIPLRHGPAVGRLGVDQGAVEAALGHLREIDVAAGLGGPHLERVQALLAAAAAGAERWTDVFAKLLQELLGATGVLLVDPLQPEVAALWRPQLLRELSDPEASAERIRLGAERLEARGYAAQLGRAEGATNLFVERGRGHPRTLLRRSGAGWEVGGESVALGELAALLEGDPTAITPAAGLRPVLQDAVFPTALFVVGPGELRYLAQLRSVYQWHGVAMPLIWVRPEFTILQPPVRRILERHGLDWRTFMRDPKSAHHEVALRVHGHAEAFAQGIHRVEEEMQALLTRVEAIDPTLSRTVGKGERALKRTVLNLREKSAQALARRDETLSRQMTRVEAHLRPNGGLQERVLSPFTFFLTVGPESLVAAMLERPPEGEQVIEF